MVKAYFDNRPSRGGLYNCSVQSALSYLKFLT